VPRSVVGLLAAVGTAMSLLAALAHGDLFWAAVAGAAVAWGLAAYLALPPTKKNLRRTRLSLMRGTNACHSSGL
jgi:O-antigen/teichoic acid export membrane protein